MDDLNYAVVKPMEDISCISHGKKHMKNTIEGMLLFS